MQIENAVAILEGVFSCLENEVVLNRERVVRMVESAVWILLEAGPDALTGVLEVILTHLRGD